MNGCPIQTGVTRITSLTYDLSATIRRLKGDLRQCRSCAAREGCPTLSEFTTLICAAIDEVIAEFNLLPDPADPGH